MGRRRTSWRGASACGGCPNNNAPLKSVNEPRASQMLTSGGGFEDDESRGEATEQQRIGRRDYAEAKRRRESAEAGRDGGVALNSPRAHAGPASHKIWNGMSLAGRLCGPRGGTAGGRCASRRPAEADLEGRARDRGRPARTDDARPPARCARSMSRNYGFRCRNRHSTGLPSVFRLSLHRKAPSE